MFRALVSTCFVVGCLVSLPLTSPAQEIIHALTGTVSSIDSAAKTITVFQDNGSKGVYQQLANSKTRISFDKRVQAESTAAKEFDKQGAYAIVFYFGNDGDRTVVAVKSLGSGPFQSTNGTVKKYDGHSNTLSVEDEAGKLHTFKVDAKTVAETNFGAVNGGKFDADKGDHVRIVSSDVNGTPTALFVRDL